MYSKSFTVCLALIAFLALAACDDIVATVEQEEQQHETNVIPQSTGHPNEQSLSSSFSHLMSNGGAVAAVILAVGALAFIIPQLLGYKICSLIGCDSNQSQAYSASGSGYGDYQGYPQGTYNNPVYQKRSLEYVGPILKALSNAYDKYNRQFAPTSAPIVKTA